MHRTIPDVIVLVGVAFATSAFAQPASEDVALPD